MHLLEHERLSLTKGKHRLTYLLDVQPRSIFGGWRMHRSKRLNSRTTTRPIFPTDQLVEVGVSSQQTGIPTKSTVARWISRTDNIAQSMIIETSSITAKRAFFLKDRQRIGIIDTRLYTQVIEPLPSTSSRRASRREHLIDKICRERRTTEHRCPRLWYPTDCRAFPRLNRLPITLHRLTK